MKLGDLVKDSVTGFEGIIMAYAYYMHNADRAGVRCRELRDGKPMDLLFFDVNQLELIKEGEIKFSATQEEMPFDFGDYVKDTITPFEGIVVGYTVWSSGCNRINIQNPKLDKGIPVDEISVPMGQIKLVKKAKVEKPKKEAKVKEKPGGPMKNPCYTKDPH